jgi:hypothetical protein
MPVQARAQRRDLAAAPRVCAVQAQALGQLLGRALAVELARVGPPVVDLWKCELRARPPARRVQQAPAQQARALRGRWHRVPADNWAACPYAKRSLARRAAVTLLAQAVAGSQLQPVRVHRAVAPAAVCRPSLPCRFAYSPSSCDRQSARNCISCQARTSPLFRRREDRREPR